MSEETIYESTHTRSRQAIAAALRRVADALDSGGPVPVDDEGTVTADPPAEPVFEIEYEREDEELSLEFEIEWSADDNTAADATAAGKGEVEISAGEERADAGDAAAGAGDEGTRSQEIESEEPIAAGESNATFELYRDRADEWRWRLRHQNGNIIADSGEGYGKKANARNGIESVRTNAPGAVLEEQD